MRLDLKTLSLALGLAISSVVAASACPAGYVACGQDDQLCCPAN